MDYLIRFIGHTVKNRPTTMPPKVYQDVVVHVKDFEELRKEVDRGSYLIIQYQGMIVMKDPQAMMKNDIATLEQRIFVPLHMIHFVETKVQKLASEVPDVGAEGVRLN